MHILPNMDTLIFTVKPFSYDVFFSPLKVFLEENYLLAKAKREPVFIEFLGEAFEIYPSSHKNYRYILHNESYEIRFAESYDEDFDFGYPIYVRLKSSELWLVGYERSYLNVLQMLDCAFTIETTKISRMDLCFHVQKMISLDIKPGIDTVCRTNIRHIWYDKSEPSGYQFGKSPILLRIYDKHKELTVSKKIWFADIWRSNGFDVDAPIWNIELQLRRDFFSDRQIDTVNDAFDSLSHIHYYLTHKWFRVIERDEKESNQSRLKTIDWWQEIQQSFLTDFDLQFDKNITRKPGPDHLFQTMQGYLISYAAFTDSDDLDQFFAHLSDHIKKFEQKKQTSLFTLARERRSLYD